MSDVRFRILGHGCLWVCYNQRHCEERSNPKATGNQPTSPPYITNEPMANEPPIAIFAIQNSKKVGIGWYLSVFSGKIHTHHYQICNLNTNSLPYSPYPQFNHSPNVGW
jgi:hypothetical protein